MRADFSRIIANYTFIRVGIICLKRNLPEYVILAFGYFLLAIKPFFLNFFS